MRNELNFLVPFVDIEAEERAVRRVLAQRKLAVDETVRGVGFVALSAVTLDERLSAVRIITSRGVVAAEDGDMDDLFGASRVKLGSIASTGPGAPALLGIAKTERGQELGCAQYFRVRADAQLAAVAVHLERFGSRACLAVLERDAAGVLTAQVGWPSLSAGLAPTLRVDMRIDSGRLDQTDPDQISIRVDADETRFVARESERLDAALSREADFAQRQARAVAHAALALATNKSVELQLGAYHSALGATAPDAPDAELVAITRAHIEHGWDDPEPAVTEPGDEVIMPEQRAPEDAPEPDDSTLIEPPAAGR